MINLLYESPKILYKTPKILYESPKFIELFGSNVAFLGDLSPFFIVGIA